MSAQLPVARSEPGPRQPCPCGSGKRYRACHGSGGPAAYIARTFAGLPAECDWVAMRDIVAAATADVRLGQRERPVRVCSLLPAALPALVREDGEVWLGLQVQHDYGDASRDLAAVLELALGAPPGTQVTLPADPGSGPRLQDLVDPGSEFSVTVHDSFGFWVADLEDATGQLAASLEAADASLAPTVRLRAVDAAYWTSTGGKEFLRWVMPHDEDRLLDALARLHVRGDDTLVASGRLLGSFRAHGLLAPVWEIPPGTGAGALEEPAQRIAAHLADAMSTPTSLSSVERSARSGLLSRQLTIR